MDNGRLQNEISAEFIVAKQGGKQAVDDHLV